MSKLLIGSDPEIMVARNGVPYPACGMVSGTKEEVMPTEHGGVLVDCTSLEFTHEPCASEDEFVASITGCLSDLSLIAQQRGMELDFRSSYEFDGSVLDMFGADARTFGCSKDYNAYTGVANPSPDSGSNLRTCGGHIHLGYEGYRTKQDTLRLVMYLDHIVGRWCIRTDKDLTRMSRYGQVGCFRPKPYGLEYRVPSNFWLRSEEYTRSIYRLCHQAFDAFVNNHEIPQASELQQELNQLAGVA